VARQLGFKELKAPSRRFGGSLLKSHAKVKRPLESKLPIHLVLRSRKSVLLLYKNQGRVQACIDRVFKKHGVKLYKMANVGNHIHFVLKIPRRRYWAGFIRELTGRIASIAGVRGERFWSQLPFTEIVGGWRTAFKEVLQYVTLNQWQADGHIDRREIRKWKDLDKIWGVGLGLRRFA